MRRRTGSKERKKKLKGWYNSLHGQHALVRVLALFNYPWQKGSYCHFITSLGPKVLIICSVKVIQ